MQGFSYSKTRKEQDTGKVLARFLRYTKRRKEKSYVYNYPDGIIKTKA